MRHTYRIKQPETGFTLIEVLLATILSGVVASVFIAAMLNMVSTATLQKTQLEINQQSQIALDTIERDIRLALDFATTLPATTPTTFSDSYGPSNTNEGWTGTWSYKGNTDSNHRVLILKETATTTNPYRANRTPVYVDATQTNVYEVNPSLNCSVYNASTNPTGALTYNPKLPYYLIYFVRDNNLYRRTMTDNYTTGSKLCNGPSYQKQSCPSVDTSRPAACIANDELIVGNVAAFTITYNELSYGSSGVSITDKDAYNSTDPTIFQEVNNVVVTLTLQKYVGGQSRSSTLSVNVSKVN